MSEQTAVTLRDAPEPLAKRRWNPFHSSFTASCEKGAEALRATFTLKRHTRRAHMFVAFQTNRAPDLSSADDVFEMLWAQLADKDTITVVAFNTQVQMLVAGQSKSKTSLEDLKLGCKKTYSSGAALWNAVCQIHEKVSSSILAGTSNPQDNHLVLIYADGVDTTKTTADNALAALVAAQQAAHCQTVATCPDTSEYWMSVTPSGEKKGMGLWVDKPGQFYTGRLQVKAFGTGHTPSEVNIAARQRTSEKLADDFATITPHAVKQIGAEHMLDDAMRNLKLTNMTVTYDA